MLSLTDNQYQIQGIPLLDLAEKYGTPLYVYDTDRMQLQLKRLQEAFSGLPVRFKYACKALTNINILRLLHGWGVGIDAVSWEEVETAFRAGIPAQDIIMTPNCVSFSEVAQVVEKGVLVNIDNLSLLEQFGDHYGSKVPCCLRLNPHVVAGGNPQIQTGHIDSKFGISIYQLRHLLRIVENYQIQVIGLHMHTGSDIVDYRSFLQAAEVVYEAASHFSELQFMDFGSGFKVPYHPGQSETNIVELGQEVKKSFSSFCQKYGRDLELWFEPGKFFVSEAGYFLVTTNVVKQTPSTIFAGVNSGQNHLLRPMFYKSHHEILNITNPTGKPRIYNVVGYICEEDTFAIDRRIPSIKEGDVLCFLNAGAYCFSMSSNYNSRIKPAEVLLHKQQDYLIRKRENLEDLFRNQVIVDFESSQ